MSDLERRALDVGRHQLGRATRSQLYEAGISVRTVHRRVGSGAWAEPIAGVIDLRVHPPSWQGRVVEAVLAAGPRAWATRRTAAYLHGLLDVPRPDRIEVVVPRDRHRRVGPHRLRSTSELGADEVTSVRGIPCTTVARTLLDLAVDHHLDDLERWTADAARRDRRLPSRLLELTDRHRRRAGRRRTLEVLARLPHDVALLGSPLEVVGVQRLRALAAPPFVLQHVVCDGTGARVKRVDVAWPERRWAIEFDGAAYHDLSGARTEDAAVRARLRSLGWRVEALRRDDLNGARLVAVVAELRAAPVVHPP